jgi:two-component system sensor histidine kinase KdpD
MRASRAIGRDRRFDERRWGAAALAALLVVIAVLVPFRARLDPGTAALALLVGPLLAALGSLRVAIVMSAAGALAFNVLFTRPFNSLHIESATSVAAFCAYVAVSLVLGVAVDRLRRASRQSEQRAAEAVLLRDLTLELLRQDPSLRPRIEEAVDQLVASLRLRGAAVQVEMGGGERVGVRRGAGERSHRTMLAALSRMDVEHRSSPRRPEVGDGVVAVVLSAGETVLGALAVELPADAAVDESAERVVGAFANLIALACERDRYLDESVRRRVLEQAEQHRVTLVQSVSHDLRTPLTSIRALASTLPELGATTPDQMGVLDDIDREATRLARMVDQVLDLSRIDSGVLRPRLERVEVDELVASAVSAVRPLLADARDIAVRIDPDAPAVPVDEPLMRQVLVNLLENAVHHGAPPVEVDVRRRNGHLEIAVADHGGGIPERDRPHVFDASRAMRRPSADERRRGLGLVVGAGFVHAHDGDIRIEPTHGGGATFVVSLPLDAAGARG